MALGGKIKYPQDARPSSRSTDLKYRDPRPAPTHTRSNTNKQQAMVTVAYGEDFSSGIR